ncbi:restriction endonuclease subunit S [Paraburkholderia sediminicola]|uniref:restriction endonuclease subunit S n=1 Tax=Paraburkholderia sediminicola TaxID=458836 RepID=UPI0038B788FF
MSSGQTLRISDFCKTGSGSTPSRSQMNRYYDSGTIPWVKSGELRENVILETEEHVTAAALEETSVKLVPANAILLAMYGATVGRLAILGVEATTNQAICHIVPDGAIADVRYLYHALASQVRSIVAMGVGGAQPNISQEKVKNLRVALPSLPEQRRIAATLDQADRLRAKRREALVQLESLTQSIFIEMFGDPVANPKRWAGGTLGDAVSEMQYGPRFYNESYADDGIRIVRITDLDESGGLDFDAMPRMRIDEKKHSQFLLKAGDIIFARTGATVGKAALLTETSPPCIAGAYFIRMRFDDNVLPEYARAVLMTKSIKAVVAKQSRQAAQQNFSGPSLRRLPMPIAPTGLQMQFKERLAEVERAKMVHRKSLLQFDALFASLQQKAFHGTL